MLLLSARCTAARFVAKAEETCAHRELITDQVIFPYRSRATTFIPRASYRARDMIAK